jgi:hypothetical protein
MARRNPLSGARRRLKSHMAALAYHDDRPPPPNPAVELDEGEETVRDVMRGRPLGPMGWVRHRARRFRRGER